MFLALLLKEIKIVYLNEKVDVMSYVSQYHDTVKATKIIQETPKVMTMVSWKFP
jgi:hypothetical protein